MKERAEECKRTIAEGKKRGRERIKARFGARYIGNRRCDGKLSTRAEEQRTMHWNEWSMRETRMKPATTSVETVKIETAPCVIV